MLQDPMLLKMFASRYNLLVETTGHQYVVVGKLLVHVPESDAPLAEQLEFVAKMCRSLNITMNQFTKAMGRTKAQKMDPVLRGGNLVGYFFKIFYMKPAVNGV